jgi:hypothetical protein
MAESNYKMQRRFRYKMAERAADPAPEPKLRIHGVLPSLPHAPS